MEVPHEKLLVEQVVDLVFQIWFDRIPLKLQVACKILLQIPHLISNMKFPQLDQRGEFCDQWWPRWRRRWQRVPRWKL